ncbi:hypothetical protein D3C72_1176920 [compost metagenome]
MAPALTFMAPPPKTCDAPATKVPACTAVPPVYVLAPDSVSVPTPVLLSRPLPSSTAEIPTSKPLESRNMPPAPNVMSPALKPCKRFASEVAARSTPPLKSIVPVVLPAFLTTGPVRRTPRPSASEPLTCKIPLPSPSSICATLTVAPFCTTTVPVVPA